MKYKNLTLFLLLSFFTFNCFSNDLSFDLAITGTNKYLWRGQKLYNNFCIQPNLNIYTKNFIINYFASFPLNKNEYIESDFSFIASDTISYIEIIKINAGFIIYTFPNNAEEYKNSLEIFGMLNFNTPFTPYIKIYYDTVLGRGYYLEAGASYNIDFQYLKFNFYSIAGYNFNQWGYLPSFSVLLLNPELTFSISEFTLILSSNFQLSLNNQYQNDFMVNTGIKYTYE